VFSSKSKARLSAIQKARQILIEKPIYLDTETTGLTEQDEIVEIGIVDHDGKILLDELVKPSRPIPADATRVHKITNKMVADSLSWIALWPTIREVLFNRYVGIYNADFDIRMMRQSMRGLQGQVSINAFDVMHLYARFWGEWDSRKNGYRYQSLSTAGLQANISLPNSHRAVDDALLTRELLLHIANADPGI
jgi:DNA polymerase-3 subunit epsilon